MFIKHPGMKKITLMVMILLTASLAGAQKAWQKITDKAIRELTLDFKIPPPEYGMILWWGWDGHMSDTVIKRDLDRIREMGFRGVMLEAGYGMTAEYLSPEWFEMVRIAVDEAKKRGMIVWIEDEGKYPSGFAGGKFSRERPDLKMQGLVITERIDAKSGIRVYAKMPHYALSAVAYNNTDKTSRIIDITSGTLDWTAPEGDWRIFVAGNRFRSSQTRSVNNPTRGKDTTASLMDYLNPLATKQFLSWTHEKYKEYIGDEFGKTFMGFMGDEPDFAYTPWTPKILEEFKARKGYDIKPFLASFFLPQLSEEANRMKADYWDVWSDLFRDNFFTVQADWCRENNIEYIVHLNHEDQLPGLIRSSGDFFKNMRNVGIPGVDAIWAQIWMDHVADYPKLASSAAHLYGKPRAFTESFAAYSYRPTVPEAKWVLDHQLVRGINFVQIMFMSASTSRQAPAPQLPQAKPIQKPPVPTVRRTSFFQSDTFPPVAQYINRATFLLSQGRPSAKVCVYFPTLSFWYGDNEANKNLLGLSQQLTENQIDFDFADEQAFESVLSLRNGAFVNLSGQEYKAIIIPSISVISETATGKLKEFAKEGGKVIYCGRRPLMMTGKTFRDATEPAEIPGAITEPSGKLTQDMIDLLPEPDVKLNPSSPQVKYLCRKFPDGELYFFFNEGTAPFSSSAVLEGKGKAQLWDAGSGDIKRIKSRSEGPDKTIIQLDLKGWETKFVFIRR